ncbi:hypothetical protein GCM10010319_23950 [Streptomyces blastmyceticus]|uniref:Uncharacterized protein n=1 Tax=Streptomyces blastmyceticus TaxID=68180 RepID=A0ABP3GIQ9_9ACTN
MREIEGFCDSPAALKGQSLIDADLAWDPLPRVAYDGSVALIPPELAGFTDPRFGDFTTGNVLRTPLDVLLAEATPRTAWLAEFQHGAESCREARGAVPDQGHRRSVPRRHAPGTERRCTCAEGGRGADETDVPGGSPVGAVEISFPSSPPPRSWPASAGSCRRAASASGRPPFHTRLVTSTVNTVPEAPCDPCPSCKASLTAADG